jgi:hypothetical protein
MHLQVPVVLLQKILLVVELIALVLREPDSLHEL